MNSQAFVAVVIACFERDVLVLATPNILARNLHSAVLALPGEADLQPTIEFSDDLVTTGVWLQTHEQDQVFALPAVKIAHSD